MNFKNDVLLRYVSHAPLALALERYQECLIYPNLQLKRPILDLGCGDGLFAWILFDEKIDTGIDPDPRELKRAKQFDAYGELLECSGDTIPRPDGSYQTVISNSVIEHIKDLSPVLIEVKRILGENGMFYFSAPSNLFDKYSVISKTLTSLGLKNLAGKYRIFYNHFWKHYHFYTLETWRDMIQKNGFRIVQSIQFDPGKICTLNDLLAPLGFFQFLVKKISSRWVLFPSMRRFLLRPCARRFLAKLNNTFGAVDGGLIFIAAQKVSS